MKTVAIVVIVLVVLLVIALSVLAARRNKRRAALRERFGPEYDLAVKRGTDRRAVEQRLEQLAKQRDQLDIREVPVQEHVRFAQEWDAAQGRFVDDPGQAVADADGLVNSVLRSRGYPVDSFDDRAALVATDHQDVVEGYRSAHDTFAAHLQGGSTDTEALRQAFLHYREVFGRLNIPAGDVQDTHDQRAVAPASVRREVESGAPAPASSEPASSEPAMTEPAMTEPAWSEPAMTEPAAATEPAAETRTTDPGTGARHVDHQAPPADGNEQPPGSPADRPAGAPVDRPVAPPVDGAVDEGHPPERPVGAHRAEPA
jgi:hypothetical protein